MLSITDVESLAVRVVGASFALGIAFGAIAQRTQFCTMGGVADIVNFGDWTRMRQWLLAIAVAIIGTTALAAGGAIDTDGSFYTAPRFRLLGYLIGGSLFGFGMVLAGGCGSRLLVRSGAGSLKGLIAALALGLFAYLTLRGIFAELRVAIIEPASIALAVPQDLPSLLAVPDVPRPLMQLVVGSALAAVLLFVVFRDRSFASTNNVLAGVGIGSIIVALWYVSGHLGYVDEHPATLEAAYLRTNSGRMEALSFVAPVAWTLDYLMFFSDASKVVTVGVAAIFGVVVGSAAMALSSGRFRWEGFRDTEDTANHLVGGALMGIGGVTAMGCTIGQGLSGVSMLSAGAFVATASIIFGAVLALRYQVWRIDRVAAQ